MMLEAIGREVVSWERAMVIFWQVSGNGEQVRRGGEGGVVAILWRGAVGCAYQAMLLVLCMTRKMQTLQGLVASLSVE